MKKLFYSILFMLLPMVTMAETYSQLWKSVEQANRKDQPKTVIQRLQTIVQKAEADREWGHFIKAHLQMVSRQEDITPDSLRPQLERLEALLAEKGSGDVALDAVCNSVMGHVYASLSENPMFAMRFPEMSEDSCRAASKRFYAKSIANMQALTKEKASQYEPLMVQGDGARIFDNDLAHVLFFEAQAYDQAVAYYKKQGNDAAACLSAFYKIQKERFDDVREIHKSKYKARLDSLINEYQNLPEAGEVAIERFNFMDNATDATSQEKIEYIDHALRTWPTWPRMAILRNARQRITLPSFHVHFPETSVIPDRPIAVNITSVININHLEMKVTKLSMTGAEEFDPNNEKDMKMLRSLMADKPLYVDSRDYYGLPDYKEVNDTMNIIPLPVGIYLVEFTTDNREVSTERLLLHVSNLRLMDMDMPGKQVRLIAVNATTGKPVGGAKVILQFRQWKNGRYNESEEILTTESNGEVTFSSTLTPYRFRVTTQNDKALPWQSISTSWQVKQDTEGITRNNKRVQIYTDRAIYRPKQVMQASVMTYENDFYARNANVLSGQTLDLKLLDNMGKELQTESVTTDEWGVANVSFQIPETDRTGMFTIVASSKDDRSLQVRRYVRVEEYKRPTFTVSIDDYELPYKVGDTITVRGWAKTYAGVPVQNAKVTYSAMSRTAGWWRRYMIDASDIGETYRDEIQTAADGSFEMRLPIVVSQPGVTTKYFFNECGLNVDVVSLSGESHSAQRYFRVSNKETMLMLSDFSEYQCLENLQKAQFSFVNNAGTPVSAKVTYRIDDGEKHVIDANMAVSIDFSGVAEGRHKLYAYCETDSLEQSFILFSLDDERPVIDTDAWSYDSPGLYNAPINFVEGEPVKIQIGTSRDDQTVFYAIISEKEVLEEGSFVLSNANHNRSFIYKEEWGDGIALRYSWTRNGKVYTFVERLHRPEKPTNLELEWTSFRDKLMPGQKEEWTISVKGTDGKPAAAHMIATIYDKSLEELAPHSLPLNLNYYSFTPHIYTSQRNLQSQMFLYGEQTFRPLDVKDLTFYQLCIPDFSGFGDLSEVVVVGYGGQKKMMSRAMPLMAKAMANDEAKVFDVMESKAVNQYEQELPVVADEETTTNDVQIRENLNETAAFMPTLVTDKNGNVSIKFTLPEALTTWRFLGLAHDKQMNNGSITGEAVSQKPLMVQPNMPRFLREGDKTTLLATIANTTDKQLGGQATLQLLNAETEKVVYQANTQFTVGAENTGSVSFQLPANLVPDVYICKIIAKTKTYSDGEQQYLPVISKRELITTTRAITQVKAGKTTVNLDELFGKGTQNEKVSIEYTNNPAWLMVDALPAVIHECDENANAINYSAALYAASLVRDLKLQGVKAEVETDSLGAKVTNLTTKLSQMQNADGSFSWYPEMPGSPYITLEVARNIVRLEKLQGISDEAKSIVAQAMKYLAVNINKEVAELRKAQSKGMKNPLPSELAMDYLYLRALRGEKLGRTDSDNVSYLLGLLKNASASLSIYGKANMAVAFAKSVDGADKNVAEDLMESVMQYSVATDIMGRYFDTPKAHLSWRNYTIPTETAAIEALQMLRPDDKQSVAQMQQWLLNEKRTQLWDTPINSTSAIYAFLNGNLNALDDVAEPAKILLDGKTLLTSGKERGYFKTTETGRHRQVVFDKKQQGISFGSVMTEAMQKVDDVKAVDDNSLHVKRELIAPSDQLKVGDKVTVRITVRADRDMDFLEVEDNRAACLEPVVQTSGYRYGAYVASRDTKTCYYFHHIAKGMPVVMETEYYIDRSGEFVSGLATARCAYAPEFSARAEVMTISSK